VLEHTQAKLEEARFFLAKWKDSSYGTAEFRYFFSALVSAGRSVTWVLKKELRSLDPKKFDTWWEEKRDSLLPSGLDFRTLAGMRNEAVKEGALLPTSFRVTGFESPAVEGMEGRYFPGNGPGSRLQVTMQMRAEEGADQPDLSEIPEELWDEALGRYAAGLLRKALEDLNPEELELEDQGLVVVNSGEPVSSDDLSRLWHEYLENLQNLVEAAGTKFA
jgi:hypothetical protein